MLGLIALVVALLHLAAAGFGVIGRVAPSIRTGQLGLGLAGGALGIGHWLAGADSRWLVGGIPLLAGTVPGWYPRAPRAARIVGLVLSLLGTALYAIATATARHV